jgi:hypothetical protein
MLNLFQGLNFSSIKGIYTIFLGKGEVYSCDGGKSEKKRAQTAPENGKTMSLLQRDVPVLLAVPVRVLHVSDLHV